MVIDIFSHNIKLININYFKLIYNFLILVVFPDPVSPITITTLWFSNIKMNSLA